MKVKLTTNRTNPARRILPAIVFLTFCFSITAAGDLASLRREIIPLSLEERNIESLATRRVQPAYPPMAQKYKIEGTVVVEVTVAGDGRVTKAEFIRGHNIFRSVSLDAAKRWEFKAPGESGLQGTMNFVFKLND